MVEERGDLPFEPDTAHPFFQQLSRRYERGAMLIAANRLVDEQGPVSGDAARQVILSGR